MKIKLPNYTLLYNSKSGIYSRIHPNGLCTSPNHFDKFLIYVLNLFNKKEKKRRKES